MGRKGKQTTFNQRQLVIFHHEKGKTIRNIADLLPMKRSTLFDIILRYKNEDRIELIKQTGRRKVLTDREESLIIRQIEKNPRISAPKLASEIESATGKKNRRIRLQFAKEYENKGEDWLEKALFSDESIFNVFGSDGRQMVWRKPKEEMKTKNLRATVKHGRGNVMIWGCMAASGVGELVFIEDLMKKEDHLHLLQHNLEGWIKAYFFKEELKARLQEDWMKIPIDITNKLVHSMPRRLKEIIKQKGGPTRC
ncbi:hypothetical protein ANN_04124 [Periplaneta americana]|uniref:Transposase n=1 Tax=Periplaneta americana TaxID=6978 RepID=A0ABQ8T9I1_PERAM|nr:hypothetical protein ANN_04124 [Periplaneta americana]